MFLSTTIIGPLALKNWYNFMFYNPLCRVYCVSESLCNTLRNYISGTNQFQLSSSISSAEPSVLFVALNISLPFYAQLNPPNPNSLNVLSVSCSFSLFRKNILSFSCRPILYTPLLHKTLIQTV